MYKYSGVGQRILRLWCGGEAVRARNFLEGDGSILGQPPYVFGIP